MIIYKRMLLVPHYFRDIKAALSAKSVKGKAALPALHWIGMDPFSLLL